MAKSFRLLAHEQKLMPLFIQEDLSEVVLSAEWNDRYHRFQAIVMKF